MGSEAGRTHVQKTLVSLRYRAQQHRDEPRRADQAKHLFAACEDIVMSLLFLILKWLCVHVESNAVTSFKAIGVLRALTYSNPLSFDCLLDELCELRTCCCTLHHETIFFSSFSNLIRSFYREFEKHRGISWPLLLPRYYIASVGCEVWGVQSLVG